MARLKSRHKETPVFQIPVRSHSFSQNTKQLQRTFVPRRAGGGSKLGHSCGLVASKEGAGLKPSATCKPARKQTGGSTPLQSEDGGVKPPLQRLDHNHENQQKQRCPHLETNRRCSCAAAVPQSLGTRRLFTSSAA